MITHRVCLPLAAVILLSPTLIHAQTFHTCRSFAENPHDAADCLEALFSEDPLHLTFSGMPPGNGFAVGGVLEQNTHFVSPFAGPMTTRLTPGTAALQPPNTSTSNIPSLGSLWSADGRVSAIVSFNGSWTTVGMLTIMPRGYRPGHRLDHNGVEVQCNRLGFLCTNRIFGLHFEAEHRSLQTVSFYGIGPKSPSVKYTFHQDDTYGSVRASLPIADWLSVESGLEARQTDLPPTTNPNSVSANFTPITAPGLTVQPTFIHTYVALRTAPVLYVSPRTDDQELNHTGPLMKPYLLFTLRNAAEYHWFAAQSDAPSSFQQLILDSDENIQVATVVRHYVQVQDIHGALSRFVYKNLARDCGDTGIDWSKPLDYVLKVRQRCSYGSVDIRSHVVASRTGPASTVPFYLQPTVGGSDIDSRLSLRAYPSYRFRAPDAVAVQADITLPLNLLVFYDAGTVGPNFSSLSFAHLRQDAGVGFGVSLQGNIIAQAYMAWGSSGAAPTFGYNFSKLF
ncbi:MAG: hypothetical protein ABR971_04070 [Acidobacteriaceae bacterium]|jgi:hypothetical protein